ncbi:MAG: ATP-binding protein [Deltaproteobacteria bacterium]|nr:ATP-binding protein [Deltaproteobacteria bacterium]
MIPSFERPFISALKEALETHSNFIHVVIGPRQVGKTIGVLQLLENTRSGDSFYVSADGDLQQPLSWLTEQWVLARSKNKKCLLVIDEIQKVENWSEGIKKLWDEEKRRPTSERMRVILLGSSSLDVQKGLSESLTGRYVQHVVYHWGQEESETAFGVRFEDYLVYGGYPGSYAFLNKRAEWINYLKNSIINPVLGKDILSIARVKSPALFRQCFQLACSYAAQEISYTKLLGQLQSKGNTDLVKHYLELFEGAFLIRQLQKFSRGPLSARTSSPKILVLCPALYSVTLDAELDDAHKGRAFEGFIGSQLAQLPGELYYWREGNREVDFVLKYGKKLWAIEVKRQLRGASGLKAFQDKYKEAILVLITPENFRRVLSNLSVQLE